jgi:hypothetical protein
MQNGVVAVMALLIAVALPLAHAQNALAIPAFSRQYRTECSTCHTLYPELNEYGQVFLKNGYVYANKHAGEKGGEAPVPSGKPGQGQTQTASDEQVAGLMLSGIPKWIPLSLTLNQSANYSDPAPNGDHWGFTTRDLVLEGGGVISDVVGFYATYDLYRHDSSISQGGPSSLHELFLIWRRFFGTPVNIKVGKFEPKLSLWKKSDKIIVTSFATSSFQEGNSPFSLETAQDAVEANAVVANRIFMATGVVDRHGLPGVDAYGHLSVKFGGVDFLGNEPEVDFEKESIWDYLAMTLAVYGYNGRNIDPFGSGISNSFYRIGGEFDILYKRARVKFSCVSGEDSNPYYIFPETAGNPLVFASEAEYYFGSPVKVVGLFRYEYQNDGTALVRRFIPALAYIPLENIKVAFSYIHEVQPLDINRQLLLDVSLSF